MSSNGAKQNTTIRTVRPHLSPEVIGKLLAFVETKLNGTSAALSTALRRLDSDWQKEPWALELRATALVIADLVDQGWTVVPGDAQLRSVPSGDSRKGGDGS